MASRCAHVRVCAACMSHQVRGMLICDNYNCNVVVLTYSSRYSNAITATNQVNGMLICDKKVFVGAFVPKQEREKAVDPDQSFTNMFVKNLQPDVDQEKLSAMFQQFGKIMSAVVMKDEEVWSSIL